MLPESLTETNTHRYPPQLGLSVQQSVKEVLDDLKGDGLVDFDKIGTSNCKSASMPLVRGIW
jgi:hypothetical protein